MKVYFVRHGVTEHNTIQMLQSRDTKLSEKGKEQARVLATRLKLAKIPFDACITSSYSRAKETADIIATELELSPIVSDLFVEKKQPSEIENKEYSDPIVIAIQAEIQKNKGISGYHYSDEENTEDYTNRAIAALSYLETLGRDCVLVVTHGIFLRRMIAILLSGGATDHTILRNITNNLEIENTGISVIEEKSLRSFEPGSKFGWKLASWNDTVHL